MGKMTSLLLSIFFLILCTVNAQNQSCPASGKCYESAESSNVMSNTGSVRILFDERNLQYDQEYRQYMCSIESTAWFGYSNIADKLNEQGYKIGRLRHGEITLGTMRDYDILVLAPTSKSYTEEETDAIVAFVESGGGLLQLGHHDRWEVLELVSRRFDVHYPQKLSELADPMECFLASGNEGDSCIGVTMKITDFSIHPVTEGIESAVFSCISYLEYQSKGDILARSGPFSYVLGKKYESKGPFIVLLATQKGKGRAVFSADEDFINNHYIDFLDNEQLALNIFKWLSESSDSCEDVTCDDVCKGVDLYNQECVDGNCVVNQLVESNSAVCGYDPCGSSNCPDNECYNYDLWSVKCIDGRCERNYIVEENSEECGYYEPPPPSPTLEVPSVSRVDSSLIVVGGILIVGIVGIIAVYWMRFQRKQEVTITVEELKRKLEEDYVEDRVTREEYLRRKAELERLG